MKLDYRSLTLLCLALQFTDGRIEQTAPNGINNELLRLWAVIVQKVVNGNNGLSETLFTTFFREGLFSKLVNKGPLGLPMRYLTVFLSSEVERHSARFYKKIQDKIPDSYPFPCNVTGGRSKRRPTSVHRLRPGDIDLVAQFGDSLIHGNGMMSANVNGIVLADHDVGMFIGGRDTWRQYLTLPNFLKLYNPRLRGFASEVSTLIDIGRVDYDFAEAGSSVEDLLRMAKKFVAKARKDPQVNFKEDWKENKLVSDARGFKVKIHALRDGLKISNLDGVEIFHQLYSYSALFSNVMVSIFMGGIDFCNYLCIFQNMTRGVERHKRVIEAALDYLMENSPRTIVNFVVLPNLQRILQAQKDVSPLCQLTQRGLCHCLFLTKYNEEEKYLDLIDRALDGQYEVASKLKYQQKEDFAVLPQQFLRDIQLPMINAKSTDYSYLAADCTHLSQKTHAFAAVGAWNSLMTPYGRKPFTTPVKFPHQAIKCPTERRPYIATFQNSREVL